jgi:phage baseplate assembly protein W
MTESNIKEYAAIYASLSTYEERVRLRQAELALAKEKARQKLEALGLASEDLTALGI